MGVFGAGFRILLVALAVLVERVGALLRDNPLFRRFVASPPEDLEHDLRDDEGF